ncbi:hypothetical protein BCR32DRAFT_114904 [Anaeromyces robustus]|uniref:PPM-type phosphatase domain-containing protein n=1 Tax=Anaeromyces robustus TaxID=1754192 RepID=A0A1Y1VVQ7_9FUNG|nr:hypothetical protein BCR32DRAFT_114904 [Anaeromyces robustus]|eukprot:ORX65382.1 hypothetical protein BCR32DRAFT_114904 [Anaeromyces robustus]
MYVINLGDSTAVLKTSEYSIPIRLTRQHLANSSYEHSKIEKRNISTDLFNECHFVTRMIGYSKLSNIINIKPEIFVRKINFECDQYIVISDRDVWSVLNMKDVDKIYNEVIGQMKDETLVSSNWPDVVAKRILYLVKNKYKIQDDISIIVLILYKKDMPKCKKKIEDISNITPLMSKEKAISFQNIFGMIGLGKNDKSGEFDSQSSIEKLDKNNNNSYAESLGNNKSDLELSLASHQKKRMSLNFEFNSKFNSKSNTTFTKENDLGGSSSSSGNLINTNKTNISTRYSSFKNYEIPIFKSYVSNEFIMEMENFLNSNAELNTVNWFKNEVRSPNRFSRIINQFNNFDETGFKSSSNYELENLGILDEEKNSIDSNSYRNIYSSNDLQDDFILNRKQ